MNVGHENIPTYTQFVSGTLTVGNVTPAQIESKGQGGVGYLHAAAANTGTITLGGSSVTSLGGFTLSAGQVSPPIYLDDVSKLYAIASAASQILEFLIQY